MDTITSRNNPKIKLIRSLRQHKTRLESGLFLIEGIRHVGEAADSGAEIEFLLYSPEQLTSDYAQSLIHKMADQGLPCYPTTPEVLESVAEKENPSGLLAVALQPQHRLMEFTPSSFPWGAALVDPQDPGNVGTILRTIDAVGAGGLLLLSSGSTTSGLVDPYLPGAVRASMGALLWHPVILATFKEFTTWSQEHGYHIYGTSAHGTADYVSIHQYELPAILLLGSERAGLTAEQSGICEQLIRLPMHGHATSLNLAVAAGVMLYEQLQKLPKQ